MSNFGAIFANFSPLGKELGPGVISSWSPHGAFPLCFLLVDSAGEAGLMSFIFIYSPEMDIDKFRSREKQPTADVKVMLTADARRSSVNPELGTRVICNLDGVRLLSIVLLPLAVALLLLETFILLIQLEISEYAGHLFLALTLLF